MKPLKGFARGRRNPFNSQVLGIRVRRAEHATPVTPLKLTESRLQLMHAIAAGEVKQGRGQYVGGYRWHELTVTVRVRQLIAAGWARDGKTVELTDAGLAAMGGAA